MVLAPASDQRRCQLRLQRATGLNAAENDKIFPIAQLQNKPRGLSAGVRAVYALCTSLRNAEDPLPAQAAEWRPSGEELA